MEKKITVQSILTNGFTIGIQNAASLLGAIVLWILTIWIPFINVGTTIAIMTLPIEMSKGKIFSPLSIFDKKYFSFMGEFFLLMGFLYLGTVIGMMFLFIPAIVIGLAWMLAIYLLIDKKLNPMEALVASNKMTMGYKWTIFLAQLVLMIAFYILFFIFMKIPAIGGILAFLLFIVFMAVIMGFNAYIYKELSKEESPE
ncbi:MAG: hypothetical protein LBI82_00265 [Dysgonamonadaceae bacterium]|jgi:uncharacterized membrane protein|nr:hypothetical protein [Dysgonamonadaceae bacterium]